MTSGGEGGTPTMEVWEREVRFSHRWGRHGDRASEEVVRLRPLWEAAQPLSEPCRTIMEQIIALEKCNWNLEESILALCSAIGAKQPAKLRIGHLPSVSEERWRKVWAYYLTLRDWLPGKGASGYRALLRGYDRDQAIQKHVLSLLGERDALKEFYVERFCLCLERWLGGSFRRGSAQAKAHEAAVEAIEKEISARDPEGQILKAMPLDGDGKLQPCHHKAFRRYDIIISSIGAGEWRAVMPLRGTDGFERARTLEGFLSPIEAWIDVAGRTGEHEGDQLSERIHTALGEPDDVKLFLASLLASLLRADQLHSRRIAESRKRTSAAV